MHQGNQIRLPFHELIDHSPWRVRSWLRRFLPAPSGYVFVVMKEPAVILIPEDFYDDRNAYWPSLFTALRGRRVYFLCWVRCGLEANQAAFERKFAEVFRGHEARYANHRFVFLANNHAQLAL